MELLLHLIGEKIIYAKSATEALNKSQCVILMTHWKQFEKLNNSSIKQMNKKFIIDPQTCSIKNESIIRAKNKIVADLVIRYKFFNDTFRSYVEYDIKNLIISFCFCVVLKTLIYIL